jgi:hypothetical protein
MFDPQIKAKIDKYEDLKRQAVDEEDFDTAKDIKIYIDKIKVLGNQH